MGITFREVKLLLQLYESGKRFPRVATLGRQWFFWSKHEHDQLQDLLRQSSLEAQKVDEFLANKPRFAEPFFELLGAEKVESFDNSSYEEATVICDFNQPISSDLHGCFDLVFDGGVLEHVFNFPLAIKNCMEMVKVGGYMVMSNPCNNQCGHGFYQFSPDLLFRVFCQENGFQLQRMVAVNNFRLVSGRWYEVRDPAQVGQRVQLDAGYIVQLMTVACKVNNTEIFPFSPMQSDYAKAWLEHAHKETLASEPKQLWPGIRSYLLEYADLHFPRLTHLVRTVRNPLNNRNYFTPSKD